MTIAGLNENQLQKLESEARLKMEQLSADLKNLIQSQPPEDLLGYLWGLLLIRATYMSTDEKSDSESANLSGVKAENMNNQLSLTQLILEYVHATWASVETGKPSTLDETVCADIVKIAEDLQGAAFNYCLLSSAGTQNNIFGQKTVEIEFLAKSNWVLIRSNRYQVLEQEFYEFVLNVHNDALRKAFGIDATDIAEGIQAISNAMRMGHMGAMNTIEKQMEAASAYAEKHSLSFKEAAEGWKEENPDYVAVSVSAFEDLFRGEICNVSKHTKLPPSLLEALAYERGENIEFFAPGPLSGTPFRTLPARIKPLVRLNGDYYATDLSFVRDTGYRAILWNLLERIPDYKDEFNHRQKEMSETAFPQILSNQLAGAHVHNEIWYKDPATGHWVENDTLIRLDDVLILVEAKAGAAATIVSPAVDFDRHVRSVQDLVMKAYLQCRRFFEYLNSAPEVSLFQRKAGKYVEFDRVRLNDYRVAFPIGLTLESFAPYSAMCKELPGIEAILGKYSFLSMSIDDLFVLKRFLPMAGDLMHYLEVRQSVAGIKGSRLFDEIDHLGAYIDKNRFDETMREQISQGESLVIWDGFSAVVDKHFEGDWESHIVPKQAFPNELIRLLAALNSTKAPGWLAADSLIRNYGHEEREELAAMLRQIMPTLSARVSRWFQWGVSPSLFVWLQRNGIIPDLKQIRLKVCASAIATKSSSKIAILAFVTHSGDYTRVERINVDFPLEGSPDYIMLTEEVGKIKARIIR